jgi:hypothetical protein
MCRRHHARRIQVRSIYWRLLPRLFCAILLAIIAPHTTGTLGFPVCISWPRYFLLLNEKTEFFVRGTCLASELDHWHRMRLVDEQKLGFSYRSSFSVCGEFGA